MSPKDTGRSKLAPTELRVLGRAALDENAAQIAAHLGLSAKYVQNLLNSVHRKLDVNTTTGAVAKAYRLGLLTVEGHMPTE